MKIIDLLESTGDSKIDLMDVLEDFLPFVTDRLKLKTLPTIKLVKTVQDTAQPTFGRFENDNNTIQLAIVNRHPLDTLRTLAHELVHFRQGTEHRLGPHSGDTGSEEENEANELAGIIMRDFNKLHPENFDNYTVEIPQTK